MGDSALTLLDAHGAKLQSGGMSSSGNGTSYTTTLNFTGVPAELVDRIITKQSTRDVPFAIAKFDLP